MSSNHDLRDAIVSVSTELFMRQSYAATSIKQIAKAAGCTTAALYYYFEDGKAGILREAVDSAMPDLQVFLEPLRDTSSLYELVMRLAQAAWEQGEEMLSRTRWLMVEFPSMDQEERTKLHHKLIKFHQNLADLVEPYFNSRQDAEMIAWIQYSSLFGYGQLFVTLGLAATHDSPSANYAQTLAEIIASFGEKQSTA
jgi:AcrR family transcriptional regulator